MVTLLIFILICYGLTQILVHGQIFNKIRPEYEFFHCPMCMGFWVGLGVSFFFPIGINPFFAGCLSSGTSYILCTLFGDGGLNIEL